jgi:hypothetical protein
MALLGLAWLLLPHLGHAQVQAHALGIGRGHFELVLEHFQVGVGATGLEVELLQGLECLQVLRIDRQNLAVGIGRALVVAEPRLPQTRRPAGAI